MSTNRETGKENLFTQHLAKRNDDVDLQLAATPLTLTKPDPVMLKIIDPPDAQLCENGIARGQECLMVGWNGLTREGSKPATRRKGLSA